MTLGKGAVIGDYAFAESRVESVNILGGGATVGEAAFFACTRLESFDFADLSGKIGNFAFFGCDGLVDIVVPNVTELGTASFGECHGMRSFSAASLTVVGDYAFAPYTENATMGATLVTFSAPNLKKVGEYAFYSCSYLKSIDLSKVTEIGSTAFALCSSLTSAPLSPDLAELPELAFYACTALSGLDLSGIVRFGTGCVYGVQLPSTLELTKAEYIDKQAFLEYDTPSSHYIKHVNAPNLTFVGEQAFVGCINLESFVAPKLEEIGYAAFGYTGLTEFEIFNSLKVVNSGTFEGSSSLTAFYTTENGVKTYDCDTLENVMISDGVLYTKVNKGYVLVAYPAAKADTEYTVADGTVRIDYCAALGNKFIEKLILPESLRFIGNHAFYQCDKLSKVVFKSYYAPELEGTMTGTRPEIKPDTIENYPGFDKLYKYDFYYKFDGAVAQPLFYSTFKDVVTSKNAAGLTYVIPENSEGYDGRVYKAYFTLAEGESSGTVMGAAAISFIEAVKRLPETADRFDEKLINQAIKTYNALVDKEDMKLVAQEYVDKFMAARSQYNVSVAENKINHLFDMANGKYFYDKVKDARETYLALTDAERAAVSNASVLDTKIAELAAAMGKELNFELNYEDYFPADVPDDPTDPGDNDNKGPNVVPIIIGVIAGAVAVIAIAGLGVTVLLKKKKGVAAKAEAKEPAEAPVEEAPEAEEAPEWAEGPLRWSMSCRARMTGYVLRSLRVWKLPSRSSTSPSLEVTPIPIVSTRPSTSRSSVPFLRPI